MPGEDLRAIQINIRIPLCVKSGSKDLSFFFFFLNVQRD